MELPKPALVAAGGVVGASTRWLVTSTFNHTIGSVIAVNGLGALLLVLLARHPRPGPTSATRLLVGIGFCGSLTTFSTLTVDIAARLADAEIGGILAVSAASVAVGLLAVGIGRRRMGAVR